MNDLVYSDEYALSLLKKINENLAQMNRFTDEILMCSYEELEENIDKRNNYFEKIQNNYEKLKTFRTNENKEFSLIMSGRAEYAMLSENMKKIFDERKIMVQLSHEITSKDSYVRQKLSECKDEMIERIKKLNSGNESKASKYYASSWNVKASNNVYIPRNNRQI